MDYEIEPAGLGRILPENPDQEWQIFFRGELHANFVYWIGNYTLLGANKNRACQNKAYSDKLAVYRTSRYQLARSIEGAEWILAQVNGRQNQFANFATAIWRIE